MEPINVSLIKAVEPKNYEEVCSLFNNKTLNVNYLWTDSFGDPTYYTPLLRQEQINVNQQTTLLGYAPIHLASSNNTNVNVQNFDGNTSLHLASEKDCIGVVKELTKAPNIQLSIKNNDNNTAADVANEHENFGCASPKECLNMFVEFKHTSRDNVHHGPRPA